MLKIFKNLLPYVVIGILTFVAVKPMFIKGYFPMHDDTQPARVFALAQELKQGIFPVRLVGSLGYGYGYPLFNFYQIQAESQQRHFHPLQVIRSPQLA